MKPDFYAILGVQPTDDTATIEAALGRCQPAWASGTRNPKRKHEYQSYLDLIPEIRKTLLGDPAVRAAYDSDRAKEQQAERERKLDQLQLFVHLRAAKGGLTPTDQARLEEKAQSIGLTKADLAKLTHAVPRIDEVASPAAEEEGPEEPPPAVLDPTTRRQIRVALQHLKKQNLYDLLDLPFDAPPAEVVKRTDEERARWMQKAQVTAEKTAWLEAVSYAQTNLCTPDARHRYDWTLIIQAEEDFVELVGFTVDGLPALDDSTRDALLDDAAGRGLVPDRAERLVRRVCRERGIGLSGPPPGNNTARTTPSRYLRCRSCGGLTDHAKVAGADDGKTAPKGCAHCGASLRWECPVCSKARWVDQPRCDCGFPIEHREPLQRHFEAAEQLFKARAYDDAIAHLEHILDFAPKHKGSRGAIEKIKEKRSEAQRVRQGFESLKAQRKLVAAEAMLVKWGGLVDPGSPELKLARDELHVQLREAHAIVAEGRQLAATDPAGARVLFQRALKIAVDMPEAREGLLSCPLDPPTGLEGEIEGRAVHLRWRAPAPDGLGPLGYRVVRQVGRVPANARDGRTVAEVNAPEAVDDDPPTGKQVGYAVFTRRGAIESLAGPTFGPVLMLGEVEDVDVFERDREVELRWKAPAAAAKVLVVRKAHQPPGGFDDGTRLVPLGDGLLDQGLDNDVTYHYRLFAVFPVAGGKARASRGVVVSATPHPRIMGAPSLMVGQEPGGGVRLSWPRPERGKVRVFRSARALPFAYNAELRAADVEGLGGRWLDGPQPDCVVDDDPPQAGLCHYTPMTVWNGTVVVGRGASYSCLPDPADLRAVRIGATGRVHLRWRWTPQATRTLVLIKSGAFAAGPDDPEAQVVPVQESEYGRQGSFPLTLPPGPGPWHIAVLSEAVIEGSRVVSAGFEPSSRTIVAGPHTEVVLSYSLKKPLFPGRPWTLTLSTEPPGMTAPPTALVAQLKTVPLSIDDGDIVARFPAGQDGQTFTVPASGLDLGRMRLRLFPDMHAATDGMPPTRMRHPEGEMTRV